MRLASPCCLCVISSNTHKAVSCSSLQTRPLPAKNLPRRLSASLGHRPSETIFVTNRFGISRMGFLHFQPLCTAHIPG